MKFLNQKILYLILTLSVIGMVDSIYLTYEHFKAKNQVICIIFDGCDAVLNSSYSEIFGIPLALLGLLFYLFNIILTLAFLKNIIKPFNIFVVLATFIAFIFSLYLTYLQLMVIKSFCFFCLLSAAIVSVIFFLNLTFYFHTRKSSSVQPPAVLK